MREIQRRDASATKTRSSASQTSRPGYHLGLYYDVKGDAKRALASYKRCADLYPIAARAYYNSGLIYLRGGEHAKAITAFEAALVIEPGLAIALGSLGQALQLSMGFAAALASYATAADDGCRDSRCTSTSATVSPRRGDQPTRPSPFATDTWSRQTRCNSPYTASPN